MADNIRRYARLLLIYTKHTMVMETSYHSNFIMATIGKLLRITLLMVFFYSIAQRIPTIGAWKIESLYILVATFYIVDLVASIFFQRNLLYHLPRAIQDGTFDTVLLTPVHTLFQASVRRIDPGDTLALIPFVGFWIWMAQMVGDQLTIMHVLTYMCFVVLAIILTYAITLCFGALAFWTVRGEGVGRMVDSVTTASVYPLDIYPQPFRTLFVTIIPIALFAVIPTQALFGTLSFTYALLSITITILFLSIGVVLWKHGVRRYNSVSS